MGTVKNFGSLLVVRCALGLAEGGLFPGVTFYITLWYRRHECGLRMAIFFSAATLAGAFGGLLARGISEMKGFGGRPGWAWIFILEGIVTIFIALFAKFIIHDSPETLVTYPVSISQLLIFFYTVLVSWVRLNARRWKSALRKIEPLSPMNTISSISNPLSQTGRSTSTCWSQSVSVPVKY